MSAGSKSYTLVNRTSLRIEAGPSYRSRHAGEKQITIRSRDACAPEFLPRYSIFLVTTGHSRSKNGVASLA